MADIFLSYSRKDSEIMYRLRDDLRGAGFTLWTDQGLEPGTRSWKRAIKQAIEDARCLVVIMSPDAEQSEWVELEVTHAEDIGLRIFPVLAKGTEQNAVIFSLKLAQRVDIREDYQRVAGQLVPALQRHLQPVEPTQEAVQQASSPAPDPAPKPLFPIEFDWVTSPLVNS